MYVMCFDQDILLLKSDELVFHLLDFLACEFLFISIYFASSYLWLLFWDGMLILSFRFFDAFIIASEWFKVVNVFIFQGNPMYHLY